MSLMRRHARWAAAALLAALPLLAAAQANAVYERRGDDGAVELTNLPGAGDGYQVIVSGPSATSPRVAAGVPVAPLPVVVPAPEEAPDGTQKPQLISDGPMGVALKELYDGAHAAHQAAGH